MSTGIVSFHTDTDKVRMRNEIREQIVAKLSDKAYRDIFVSEQINTGLAFQIKGTREQRGWTQSELGEKAGMAQSRISVMEDANYSRFSLSTLKRLASAFDVALVVRFEPFSKLVNHFAALDSSSLNVASFGDDIFSVQPSLPESLAIMNPATYVIEGFAPVRGYTNTFAMGPLGLAVGSPFYPSLGSTPFYLKSMEVLTPAKPASIAAD